MFLLNNFQQCLLVFLLWYTTKYTSNKDRHILKNRSCDSRLNVDSILYEGRRRGFGIVSRAYHIDTDLQVALYTGGGGGGGGGKEGEMLYIILSGELRKIRVHLGTAGGVIRVSQQQPLVNETLVGFIVHHAQVKLRNTQHTTHNTMYMYAWPYCVGTRRNQPHGSNYL